MHDRPDRRGRTIAMAVCAVTLLFGAPIGVQAAGEGDPLEGGARNPSPNQTEELTRETEIIASTGKDSYGTRQSNKGEGGGAIYGCRSSLDAQAPADPARSTPCLRVNNLAGGKAFDFVFDEGPVGGIIQAGNSLAVPRPDRAPFVTNAGGVALGLNADRVDNLQASQIVDQAVEKAVAQLNTGGGGDAACPEGTVALAGGCLETAKRDPQDYGTASQQCADAGRQLTPTNVLAGARTAEAVDLGDGEMASDLIAIAPLGSLLPGQDTSAVLGFGVVTEDGEFTAASLVDTAPFRCYIP